MMRIMTDLRDGVASIKDYHAGKITLRASGMTQARQKSRLPASQVARRQKACSGDR